MARAGNYYILQGNITLHDYKEIFHGFRESFFANIRAMVCNMCVYHAFSGDIFQHKYYTPNQKRLIFQP